MAKDLHLMAAVYPQQEEAAEILRTLQMMHRATTIDLVDAGIVSKDAEGNVAVEETHEVTPGKGAKRGLVVGALLGVVFPPSLIVGALAGGGAGAAIGKLRDTGIKADSFNEVVAEMEPGQYAVIALADSAFVGAVEGALNSGHGRLVRQGFSPAESTALEEVAAAADE